jgi:chromosome partitioning protein
VALYISLDLDCSSAIVHNRNFESVHMRTIAITINKGGVGKTMLTKSLATAATAAGLNVLVLDMDTQQNATTWGRRRSKQHDKPLPLARFTTEHDLTEELQRAGSAPAAVECADLVLIPFWNDQDPMKELLRLRYSCGA